MYTQDTSREAWFDNIRSLLLIMVINKDRDGYWIYLQVGRIGLCSSLLFGAVLLMTWANVSGLLLGGCGLINCIEITTLLVIVIWGGLFLRSYYTGGVYMLLCFYHCNGMMLGIRELVFICDVISYISRWITLALRLGINIYVGHCLLDIVGVSISSKVSYGAYLNIGLDLGLLNLIVLILIMELGVSIVQSYVLCLMIQLYLSELEAC
jgi:hypothetical protein